MSEHLLQSSHRDYSNKWSNIGSLKIRAFQIYHLIWSTVFLIVLFERVLVHVTQHTIVHLHVKLWT